MCGPRVEGVHLRGGPIARGGLRWSDRREDFRTEVLGLMKAQMVKNAVIVPTGAKGGFVVKRQPADPEAARAEVVECYRTFVGGAARPHRQPRRRRGRPPARHRRPRRRRPLPRRRRRQGHGDVQRHRQQRVASSTASGSATPSPRAAAPGYDHKAMGITARGAWESVRRHARALGRDADTRSAHRRRHRRHVRRRVRQRDAAVAGAAARRRVRPPPRVHRSRPRPGGGVRRAARACSTCRDRRGPTTTPS